MPEGKERLEDRVAQVEKELSALALRVEELTAALESGKTIEPTERSVSAEKRAPAEASEKVMDWVGRLSLLQRVSTLCFLLVVALLLRTVTDNEIIDQQVGSLLGMLYAAGLIGWGWFLYRRQSPLAPVFSVCGALLVFAIVLETHEHYEALPTVPAYFLLTAAGVAMALISHFYRVALPVFVGTLGMSLAGVALGFPAPIFSFLTVLVLVANALGTFATRLQRCTWLRWILLIVTVLMVQVWSFRLGIFLTRMPDGELPFSVSGFFPALVIFGIFFLGIAIAGILGRITERISRFDLMLPVINAVWIFAAASYVVGVGMGSEVGLGVVGVLAALAHFGVAWWFHRRGGEGAPGVNSFAVAGAVLLVMSLSMALGSDLIALAILSAVALGMAYVSRICRSGGIRMTSYLMQVYAGGALVMLLQTSEAAAPSAVGAAASAALAAMAFWHYLWARKYPPSLESKVFSRFDSKDRSATVVLVTALVSGFFTLRVGVYQALDLTLSGQQLVAAFSAGESVLINLSAAVLMCYAFARRNKEVRNVAIMVTVIGGLKVFLLDLFGLEGIPVVASVFSFGVAAFLESFALSRWQRIDTLRVSKWEPPEGNEVAEKSK
nr:DUF2339 domain-containing protein [Desulfuromonadales bacterium]